MSFSENLKKLREAKGMTQKDLATKLGVSSRIVSYYETGKSIPSDPELLKKLVELFNVTLDYLLLDTQSKSDSKVYKLVEKLIYDTQNSLVHWDIFPKVESVPFIKKIPDDLKEEIMVLDDNGDPVSLDKNKHFNSTHPIMNDFILNFFPQFNDYDFLEHESYFAEIDPISQNGYLLFKFFRDSEVVIGLFAYISGRFKFITDSKKHSIIDDLYIIVDNQDNDLNKFIEEYLNKPLL